MPFTLRLFVAPTCFMLMIGSALGGDPPATPAVKNTKPLYSVECRIFGEQSSIPRCIKFTIHEGERGFVHDGWQSPFVTGMKQGDDGNTQAIVETIDGGTHIGLLISGTQPKWATVDVT